MPLGGRTNLNVVDEELGCALEGVLACRLGLFEQWPQLQLACLLCGHEVFVQAQLGPHQAFTPSQRGLMVFAHCEFE